MGHDLEYHILFTVYLNKSKAEHLLLGDEPDLHQVAIIPPFNLLVPQSTFSIRRPSTMNVLDT